MHIKTANRLFFHTKVPKKPKKRLFVTFFSIILLFADKIRKLIAPANRPYLQVHVGIGAYQTRWWRWVCAGLAEHLVLIEQSSFTKP